MDNSFLEEQAARCRQLAERSDPFTKRRLLHLAANYEDRLLGKPSVPPAAWLTCRLNCLMRLHCGRTVEGLPDRHSVNNALQSGCFVAPFLSSEKLAGGRGKLAW
jgi:hypothetical protein